MKKIVLSLSGGKTSATLIELFGTAADYIFVNTGFEHPNTYKFLLDLVNHYKINLTCLEPVVKKYGQSNGYRVVDIEHVGMDITIMEAHVKKYGGFTVGSPHCSERMKTVTLEKYKKDKYKGQKIEHVIGFRVDEQKRMLGQQGYRLIRSLGYTQDDVIGLKVKWCELLKSDGLNALVCDIESRFILLTEETQHQIKSLVKKIQFLVKHQIHYMAEYSCFDKSDVGVFWDNMPFTLEIEEHQGNCLFCVKKDRKKVALAARENQEWVDSWNNMISKMRPMPGYDGDRQYRYPGYYKTLNEVIAEFKDISTADLAEFIYKNKSKDEDGCTESCDPFGSQINSDT